MFLEKERRSAKRRLSLVSEFVGGSVMHERFNGVVIMLFSMSSHGVVDVGTKKRRLPFLLKCSFAVKWAII